MPRPARPRRLLTAALTAGLVAVGALTLNPAAHADTTDPAPQASYDVALSAECVEGTPIVLITIHPDIPDGSHPTVDTDIDGEKASGTLGDKIEYGTWARVTPGVNTATVVIGGGAPIVKTIDTTTTCAPERGITTKAWNLAATASADGTTISFNYALLEGKTHGYVFPRVFVGSSSQSGAPLAFDDSVKVPGPGDQLYSHTLNLAPGEYTLHVEGDVACGGDCAGFLPIADDYHFTVAEQTTPTPTPTTEPSPTPAPAANPAASLSRTTVAPDSQLTITGSGFTAGESIELWLHSTPVKLATLTAAADGAFSQAITIPAGTDPGSHTIEVRGATSGSISLALSVVPGLAVTGGDDAALLPLGGVAALFMTAGAVLFAIARTRSRHQGPGAV